MPTRIIKLLIPLLLFGAIFSYLFVLNSGSVTVTYGTDRSWNAPLAIVLTVTFCLGATIAAMVAFFFALKHSYLDWRQTKRQQRLTEHQEVFIKAREHLASGNYSAARTLFKQILEYDPNNIVTRVLLASVYKKEGDLQGALHVLDEARLTHRKNLELTFLAAEIHEELGNYTAAYDNMALAFQADEENTKVLRKMISYCEHLQRFDDALNFQARLVRLTSGDIQRKEQERLALIRFHQATNKEGIEKKQALEEVLKKHKDFPSALIELAFIEKAGGNLKEATKLLTRAFVRSQEVSVLNEIAQLWLEAGDPEGAIASLRNAVLYSLPEDRITVQSHLYLVSVLLTVGMLREAKSELQKIKSSNHLLGTEDTVSAAILEAKIAEREGDPHLSCQILFTAAEASSTGASALILKGVAHQNGGSRRTSGISEQIEQPSPRLSTP